MAVTRPGLQANARDIFGSNFDRLCDIKAIYDPDNVFDKEYSLVVSNGA